MPPTDPDGTQDSRVPQPAPRSGGRRGDDAGQGGVQRPQLVDVHPEAFDDLRRHLEGALAQVASLIGQRDGECCFNSTGLSSHTWIHAAEAALAVTPSRLCHVR